MRRVIQELANECGEGHFVGRTCVAASVLVAMLALHASARAGSYTVTVAGSGSSGVADGGRFSGRFIMPTGVAIDASGNIYVADGAAQRIKVVDRGGHIRTLAGGGSPIGSGLWVAGGYRDGTGDQARFNFPTGIAAGAHGRIYIADTLNNCIRVLDRTGRVSTFAGNPSRPGITDGPRKQASFLRPLSIAVDREENVYVVGGGVRKIISANGSVDTYSNHGGTPYGIAVHEDVHGVTLFVADLIGIYVVRPDRSLRLFATSDFAFRCAQATVPKTYPSLCGSIRKIEGDGSLGFPYGIAALSSHQVAFTDLRTNTIRLLDTDSGRLEIAGGGLTESASAQTGGFSDGSPSRFNTPYAVAAVGSDRLLVADAGTKRIREVSLGPQQTRVFRAGALRVAYFGDASIAYAADPDTSIAAIVGRDLASRTGHQVDVIPFISKDGSGSLGKLFDAAVGRGHPAIAVVQLSPDLLSRILHATDASLRSSTTWVLPLTEQLRDLQRRLSGARTRLVIVTYPDPRELGSLEAPLSSTAFAFAPEPSAIGAGVAQAAASAAVTLVDLGPAFLSELRSLQRMPLFGVDSAYLAAQGRSLVARGVADALAAMVTAR